MNVRVRLFASLADLAGVGSEVVEVEPGTSVAGLWRALAARHARLAEVRARPRAACDLVYADWDRSLDGTAEVAFLPPVSGG